MLNIKWFIGLQAEDDKNKRESIIRGSREALDILSQIIKQEITSLNIPPASDYDSPSWAYKEADRLGQLRALTKLLNLTQLKKE
jgi:hypothetical protein